MKQAFNEVWKSSKQIRKQRKYRYNAPYHVKRKFLSAHLSEELRKKYQCRSFKLRAGDSVVVLRGQLRKKSGKIERVSLKEQRIFITGVETVRRDGTKELYPFEPSNLMITELNLEDKKRLNAVKRKSLQKQPKDKLSIAVKKTADSADKNKNIGN